MSKRLHTPVDERGVWTAAELEADPQWRYEMTAAETAEVLAATEEVASQGIDVRQLDRDRFRLPLLGPSLSRLAAELETGRGVIVVRGMPIDDLDDGTARIAYWGIVSHFGKPISQNSKGQLIAEVSDRGNDLSKTNTRGYSTNSRLGPHSDMCEMTSLLCVHTAAEGGESQVASALSVFNEILNTQPEHLEVLFRGFYHDLRGEGPTADINEVTHHRVPVFSYHEGRLSCCFNPKISKSGALKRGDDFSAAEDAALESISDLAARSDLSHAMWLARGDIQIVNNHTILHSRNEYRDGDDPRKRRKLYRIWMQPHLARPLMADFANRYNTGPRGGVAVGDGARYEF